MLFLLFLFLFKEIALTWPDLDRSYQHDADANVSFFLFKSSKRTTCWEYLIRFRVQQEAFNCNTFLNQTSNFLKTNSPMRELLNEHTLTIQQVVTFTIWQSFCSANDRTNEHAPPGFNYNWWIFYGLFQWCQILPQQHHVFKCQIYMFFHHLMSFFFQWSFMRTWKSFMVCMMFRWVSHLHVSPPCRTSVFRQNGLRFYVESLSKKLQVQGSLLLEQLRWIMISSIPGVQMWMVGYLGCGNSNMFYSHPENWGRWTHFDVHIFQKRVGSTTNQLCIQLLYSWSPFSWPGCFDWRELKGLLEGWSQAQK